MKKTATCGAASPRMWTREVGSWMMALIWFSRLPAMKVPKKTVSTCRRGGGRCSEQEEEDHKPQGDDEGNKQEQQAKQEGDGDSQEDAQIQDQNRDDGEEEKERST